MLCGMQEDWIRNEEEEIIEKCYKTQKQQVDLQVHNQEQRRPSHSSCIWCKSRRIIPKIGYKNTKKEKKEIPS